ncbi:MAG: phosphatase PAP2 family protein [Oscillospiraceae bacterium]
MSSIVESARAEATGYSFPSGHTQNVFASFGCLGRWTRRTWLRVVCAVVIVLTAFSRMYLGVHTPLDVGVSFGIGLVLVFALYPLFRDVDSHPNRLYWLFGAMAVLGLRTCSLPSSGRFPRTWTPPTSPPAARTPTRCSVRCWA